jgi:hypothetical protein
MQHRLELIHSPGGICGFIFIESPNLLKFFVIGEKTLLQNLELFLIELIFFPYHFDKQIKVSHIHELVSIKSLNDSQRFTYSDLSLLHPVNMAGQNHHFNIYAPTKNPYAMERYTKEMV